MDDPDESSGTGSSESDLEPDEASEAEPIQAESIRAEPVTAARSRLDVAAGIVLLGYATWVTAQLATLLVSEEAYDGLQDLHAGAAARAALALVVLAALWHAVGGALALLADRVGGTRLRPGVAHNVTAFVTLAVGIPGALVILWPALVGIPT